MAIVSITSSDASGFETSQSSPQTEKSEDIAGRKAHHLEICVDEERYTVESADSGFSAIRFLPRSLPEVAWDEVDTRLHFLDHEISLPVMISCMTGGSAEGNLINHRLAEAAQRVGIPVGTGSIRILFRDDSYFEQFHVKPLAPDVPVITNLSAVQVREFDHRLIAEILRRLEVQALAIHLNAAQELFQPNGDRDFRGLKEAISRFCDCSPVPVIVKETGFGMRPSEVDHLIEAGVAYVDLAGAGGTNWVRVESYRVSELEAKIARELDDWGVPTALLLVALQFAGDARGDKQRSAERRNGRIIASGGLRSGLDVAKSLALGAEMTALALPLARAVVAAGADGVVEAVEAIERGLRTAMVLTGCTSLDALRSQSLLIEEKMKAAAGALCASDAESTVTSDG